jgi:hypothetical protein
MQNTEFLKQYAREIEADIARIKGDLAPLESGQMQLREREGNGPWVDTTAQMIESHKRAIAKYERILADINRRISAQAA